MSAKASEVNFGELAAQCWMLSALIFCATGHEWCAVGAAFISIANAAYKEKS